MIINIDAAAYAGRIQIGKQGENLTTSVAFDCNAWLDGLDGGTLSIVHQRNSDPDAYPCGNYSIDGKVLTWSINETDLAFCGLGQCELRYTIGERIAKSKTFVTQTIAALDPGETPPEAWEPYIDRVIDAARQEMENMTVSVSATRGDSAAASVEKTVVDGHENLSFTFVLPKGDKGDKGDSAWETSTELTPTLSSGKHITYSGGLIGTTWQSRLTNSNNSEYLENALDLSSYVGKFIKITASDIASTSARAFGFCNSAGVISSIYKENDAFTYNSETGLYEFESDVTDTNFFFSIKSGENPRFYLVDNEIIDETDKRYYKKSEIDTMLDGVLYDVIKLTEDATIPITLTKNTIIYGNGHKVDCGIRLDGMFSEGIAEIPYSVEQTNMIFKVFVSQTEPLEVSGSRPYYNVTIWGVDSDNPGNSIILTPYLTRSEVEANDNSFTYDGTNFVIHAENPFDEIVLSTASACLSTNGFNVKAYDTTFLFGNDCVRVENCDYEFSGCTFGYAKVNNCFTSLAARGRLVNCEAFQANNDGFNFHNGYSSEVINCSAHDCQDDGASHHNIDAYFIVDGGEYYNNRKGGVASPTYSSNGTVRNVYSHNNNSGIYATADNEESKNVLVFNCVFKNNTNGIYCNNYHIKYYNCKFEGNTNNFNTIGAGTVDEL